MIEHREISLPPFPRGFHLITSHIEKELPGLPDSGLLHLLLKHTSAALTLNENADPTVRMDFESFISRMVPGGEPYFRHVLEGEDDMPAHIKSSLFGTSLSIPIRRGRLDLGTWQGIYLCEFRDHGGSRRITLTVMG
jgi:secondary thiamine-phosphate synthase enzyme